MLWALGDERLDLGDELVVASEGEPRLTERVDRCQAEVVEPGDLGLGEILVARRRRARARARGRGLLATSAPPRRPDRRRAGATLVEQAREEVGIDLRRRRLHDVAVPAGEDAIRVECSPQAGNVSLQALRGRRRLVGAVEVLEHPVGRHDLVPAQEQDRQECPLPGTAQLARAPVVAGLERPEDPKVHAAATGCNRLAARWQPSRPILARSRSHGAIAEKEDRDDAHGSHIRDRARDDGDGRTAARPGWARRGQLPRRVRAGGQRAARGLAGRRRPGGRGAPGFARVGRLAWPGQAGSGADGLGVLRGLRPRTDSTGRRPRSAAPRCSQSCCS